MDVTGLVRDHYGGEDLEAVVLAALARAGVDADALRVGDLSGLDQLHAGSGPATEHLLDALDLDASATLLDVGCGVGGPARLAAHRHGCRVVGVDLSPDFVDLARRLTRRLGLDGRVAFVLGSATALPCGDGSLTSAMLDHAGMNMPDKAAVFREVRRVLRPGGRFAVYDQMRTGDGPLRYPLPWSDTEAASFVERRERYAGLLADAGFVVEHDEDRTAAVAALGPPSPGSLTPADLFGPGFAERIGNNIAAAMEGTLGAVLMVARAV